jgi:CBS domain containing-hemolysin-like protein
MSLLEWLSGRSESVQRPASLHVEVPVEDLLEEPVGPIADEHDLPAPADPIRELGGSLYEVDVSLTLADLNERLGLDLPTDAEFQTVGGLVFHELGRLPGITGSSPRREGARVDAEATG